MKHSITLPSIVRVGDYHQFDEVRGVLKELGVKGIKVRELGYNGDYVGVAYVGNFQKAKKSLVVTKAVASIKKFERR